MTSPIVRKPVVTYLSSDGSPGGAADTAPLDLTLLGSLTARRDGTEIPLRLPRTAQRLLAYVLLHRERIQSRERVAFLLWPDDEEADARANLRRQLHLLSRALPATPEPYIVTTPTTLAWNARANVRLDIAEFERLSADVGTADAADLVYAGDLLPDLDDEWLLAERDRLRTLAVENCSALVSRYNQRRDFAAAIRYAHRLRAMDPWREDAVRALIAVRLEAGDRSGAIAEYERFRAELMREMGVEPMPETVCAYERALADAGGLTSGASGPTVAASSGVRVPARGLPFVGRRAELERLVDDWTAASSGHGTTALVVGEAGIGKSRLIDVLGARVDASGGRIVRGGTSPFELGPYQAVAEALRSARPMLRKAKIEPVWLAALAAFIPQLTVDFPKLPQLAVLDAHAERTRLFEAVARALAALAEVRPILVVLEDLHWAGPATVTLLEYIVRRAPASRMLVVASYREDDLAHASVLRALRRRLERESLLRVTALGALEAADVAEIVAEFVDDGGALARDLLTTTDGNPLLLGELVMNARESGVLDDDRRKWLAPAAGGASLPSLTTTLGERLDRLRPRTRSLVEIASVVGRSFSAELVREASGIDERTALDSLSELVNHRLIREVDAGNTDFAFAHQLIQQTIYATMSADARTRRHRRIGDLIEELYGENIEQFAAELASHYDQGREPERAAEYCRLAARQALGLYGNDEAKHLAARGLELVSGGETQMALLEILEEAHRRLGERDEQRTVLAEMIRLAQSLDNFDMMREVLRRRILLAHACAKRDDERQAIAALEAYARGARAPWPAITGLLKGSYFMSVGAYEDARRQLSAAIAATPLDDFPKLAVDCRCALVELAGYDGKISEIRAFLDELRDVDTRYAGTAVQATLLEAACSAASRLQDYVTLARLAEKLLVCSTVIGYREGEGAAYKFAGRAAFRAFEPDRARELLQKALAICESLDQRLTSVAVLADLGNLATSIGRFDEAIALLERAESISRDISYGFGEAACANNISYAACLKGDFVFARSVALRALETADLIDAPAARAHALVNLGVAERELGELDASITHLESGTALERTLGESVALGEDLCELIFAVLRADNVARARDIAGEVLELADPAKHAFAHPQFLYWSAAAAFYAAGHEVRARDLLATARRLLEEREAEITDPESRATFRRLPYNCAIDAAHDHGSWRL